MENKLKIIGTTWFTEMSSSKPIGIVLINNGFEERAYIGTGSGLDIDSDTHHIMLHGAKFPLSAIPTLGLTPYSPSTNNAKTVNLNNE